MNLKPLLLIMSLLIGVAAAQDGLYAPEPPANAAFVRIIHAAPGTTSFNSSIGEATYAELEFQSVSPYAVVTEGSYDVSLAGVTSTLEVAAGNFYTVALVDTGAGASVVALKDPSNTNLAKSLLILYNFSDVAAVDMKTADGAQTVVSGVAPMSVGSIVVNPVAVDLAAFGGSDVIESFSGIALERGAAYSMVVLGGADSMSAVWVLSVTQ